MGRQVEKLRPNSQGEQNDEAPATTTPGEKQGTDRVYYGTTKDGKAVYDRMDGSHFHPEGGLTPELLSVALGEIDTRDRNILGEVVEFEKPVGETTCVGVGPEDEVVMVYRKGRRGQTPMVKNRGAEPCSTVKVVLTRDRHPGSRGSYELLTAFVGKDSPIEPWDPNYHNEDAQRSSEEFWSSHALLYDEELVDQNRTEAFKSMSNLAKEIELFRPRVFCTGIFVDERELQGKFPPSLERPAYDLSVLIDFKPDDIMTLRPYLIGKNVKMRVVGYGNDGQNEAVKVEVITDDPELRDACDTIETLYIGLSSARGAQAKDAAHLDFAPIAEPFEVNGVYGLYAQGERIDTEEKFFAAMRNAMKTNANLVDSRNTQPIKNVAEKLEGLEKPFAAMNIGIPGSGKSSLAAKIVETMGKDGDTGKVAIINPDSIREEFTGDAANKTMDDEVWEETYRRADNNLKQGISVIIDATYTNRERRQRFIESCKGSGAASIAAIVVQTDLDVAKKRNAARSRHVPEEVLENMYEELQQEPVSESEGINSVISLPNNRYNSKFLSN